MKVVYLLIPTSNHNYLGVRSVDDELYIFWFLHQTTTLKNVSGRDASCISFDSYIKPQPSAWTFCYGYVVYLLIPTSNHNLMHRSRATTAVVYLLIPTSNHNPPTAELTQLMLYIFWFLHQTTTERSPFTMSFGCISFDSYIKPQLGFSSLDELLVVYLLIPTSNHNCSTSWCCSRWLYIFWFLHQTTTAFRYAQM